MTGPKSLTGLNDAPTSNPRAPHARRVVAGSRKWLTLSLSLAFAVLGASGCKSCGKVKDLAREPEHPAAEGGATSHELLTKVGLARALATKSKDLMPSTATKWSRIFPIDTQSAVLGGSIENGAVALRTTDGGRTWASLKVPVEQGALLTFSVGADKTVVVAIATRQLPKKKLPKDVLAPIDTLTLYFGSPDDTKLSAPSPIIAPVEKGNGPTIPKGFGAQAVLSKTLTSFPLEMKPKVFALAYGVPPGEELPPATPLPQTETPVYGAYGRPPVLLTASTKGILFRPWPQPKEPLATPKPVDRLAMTKTLVDELSAGPECEHGVWSFRRVSQPGNKTFVVAASREKVISFELPQTVDNKVTMGCGDDYVVVEALNPADNLPSFVTCKTDGNCIAPENRPFLKPVFKGDRVIGIAPYKTGILATQSLQSPTQWQFLMSRSETLGKPDALGKIYDGEKLVLEGEGDRGRLDYGALVGLGDRTLLLISADVTGTTARQWFVIATDDGGQTWNPP